jgi:hypothetical protein
MGAFALETESLHVPPAPHSHSPGDEASTPTRCFKPAAQSAVLAGGAFAVRVILLVAPASADRVG